MTPLQALETIKKALNREWGSDTCENDLKPEIDLLTALVTPPTAEEVRTTIENEIEWETEFRDNGFYFKDTADYIVKLDDEGRLLFGCRPTPHLISIIARFYEGVE